jgi:hypothetical protein
VSPQQCVECGAVATAARTIGGLVIALCEVHAREVDADSQHGAGEEDARMTTRSDSSAVRWVRTDQSDGASEVLLLCRRDADGTPVIQVTTGLDVGADFVGLYALDGSLLQSGNVTWTVVSRDEATPEWLATETDSDGEPFADLESLRRSWESGSSTVVEVAS